ncbi:MAG: nuclear transport factor 2 family protein [Myxococcaceae bacterium]|jgi:hypothetical protein|nr:nuclear transport factor 2 family protein [Myxococcaceae bacterium]
MSLQTARDWQAIAELRHRFGRALDERQWSVFDTILEPQLDVDLSAFGIAAATMPRAQFVALYQHSFRRPEMKSHQLYANFEISVVGEVATATSSLFGRHWMADFPGGAHFTLHARYHDRLTRASGDWRLAATRLEVLFTEGNVGLIS